MSDDDEFDSSDSNGIKSVNVSFKDKRKTRLSPLLNRRISTHGDNTALGNEKDGFDNPTFPSSRQSPSLGRRSPRLSPRLSPRTTCGCMPENNKGLIERNIPKSPECGLDRGVSSNSTINAALNEPLLGQHNACKLYTSGNQLKKLSSVGVKRELRGFDDVQVLDVEDQPRPVDYITIDSKARLPKIVVTDVNKRLNQNVSSGTELATPIKLPPISSSSTPRTSSSFKFSELLTTPEHDQGNEEIPE